MAAQRSMWSKVGKYISALVLACFFLPFFGVSCDGMDVITISGADMVGGCKPGGLITAAEEEGKMTGGTLETKIDDVSVEPFALGALAMVLVIFGLAFVSSRKAVQAALVAAVLAIGLLVALYVEVREEMLVAVAKEAKSIEKVEVSAGGRFGLWICGLGLLSVIGMTASALRARSQPASKITPPDPLPPPIV